MIFYRIPKTSRDVNNGSLCGHQPQQVRNVESVWNRFPPALSPDGALVCHLPPRFFQRLGALGNSRLLRLVFDTAALRYGSVGTVNGHIDLSRYLLTFADICCRLLSFGDYY